MKNQMTVEGIFRLTTPLHISAAEKGRIVDMETLRIRPGNPTPDAPPITTVVKMPITSAAEGFEEELEGTEEAPKRRGVGGQERAPYIPANTLKNRLRRVAAKVVYDAIQKRGEKLSLETYHGMMCGAATGQPGKMQGLNEAREASTNPFLGIFGGGPRMAHGAIQVRPAFPIVQETISASIVPGKYAEQMSPLPLYACTTAVFFRRVDDVLEFRDPYAERIIDNYEEAVREWQKAVGENAEARKKQRAERQESGKTAGDKKGGAKKMSLQSFQAREDVIPGIPFYFRLTLDLTNVGMAGAGLLLQALNRFALEDGQIGGKKSLGCGFFTAKADLTLNGQTEPLWRVVDGETMLNQGPLQNQIAAGWETALPAMTAASLEKIYRLPTGGTEEEE